MLVRHRLLSLRDSPDSSVYSGNFHSVGTNEQSLEYDETMMTREWDIAGITNESGRLDRPVAEGKLSVPAEVKLDQQQGLLRWRYSPEGRPLKDVDQPPSLLTDFVKLSTASDEQIRAFAAERGVLWLCKEHGLPATHDPRVVMVRPSPRSRREGRIQWWCPITDWSNNGGAESILAWRALAEQARAILNVAARLHLDRPPDPKDWDILELWEEPTTEARWRLVVQVVDRWLAMARARPSINWDHGKLTVSLAGLGLFGALVVQLLFAISRREGFATCDACGAIYVPDKRPPGGRRHYCLGCRGTAARRDASRDYRRRQKARGLRDEGLPFGAIAARLNTTVETVKGWTLPKRVRRRRPMPQRHNERRKQPVKRPALRRARPARV